MSDNSALLVAVAAARAADDKKADNIEVLKMPEVMADAEYFVICSAPTQVQIRAIVFGLTTALQDLGVMLLRLYGRGDNTWVLLDYGHVVVHVFQEEAYDYYALGDLWADAERVSWA